MELSVASVVDTHHLDADPDADFYLMWMQILMRIQVIKTMRIHADPDPQHCPLLLFFVYFWGAG